MTSNRSRETFEQQIMDQTSNTEAQVSLLGRNAAGANRNAPKLVTEAASVRLVGYSFEPTARTETCERRARTRTQSESNSNKSC